MLKAARQALHPLQQEAQGEEATLAERDIPEMQAVLKSGMNMIQFRELTVRLRSAFDRASFPPADLLTRHATLARSQADTLTKLVRLPGIVISASTLTSRATSLHLLCKGCRSTLIMPVHGGMDSGARSLPRKCQAEAVPGTVKDCPLDPYVILHDRCRFVDQQMVKLQEAPDMVPVGELPRHMQLSAERCVAFCKRSSLFCRTR